MSNTIISFDKLYYLQSPPETSATMRLCECVENQFCDLVRMERTVICAICRLRVIITSRVPVEWKSSVCAISMKYRKMILIIIIISLGQILLSYIANTFSHAHTRAHARAHALTHPPPTFPIRLSLLDGSLCPTMTKLSPPFRRFRWRWMAIRCFIQINSRVCDAVFAIVFGVFLSRKKISRPIWDANSLHDMLSVDTNSLRHLPRWFSTCSLITPTDLRRIIV